MFTKSNLEILQDIKKQYHPDTAFGNTKLLKLLSNIKRPNKDGEFETFANANNVKICHISWKCIDCGQLMSEEFHNEYVEEDEVIKRICNNCQKKHKLTVVL